MKNKVKIRNVVYIESHCPQQDEFNKTVGKNNTAPYILLNLISKILLLVIFETNNADDAASA